MSVLYGMPHPLNYTPVHSPTALLPIELLSLEPRPMYCRSHVTTT